MRATRALAAFAFVLASAATAPAQNADDHMTCYKVSDPTKISATADIDTARLGVSADCKIGKTALVCECSHLRTLGSTTPTVALGGPRSTGERICYKVKCPTGPSSTTQQVSDEFGTRTVTKMKTSLVCSPSVATAAVQHNGLDHYPRGLADLATTNTANGPTLHVRSLDGLDPATPDASKSAVGDPGGSGVVVVLQNVAGYGVRVRSERDSRASLNHTKELRVGAVLNIRNHSRQNSESMADAISVAAGASGVSSTAYFPRLQRQAGAAGRTGTVTCMGAVVGSSTEATPGDPNWTWFSPVWPDRYDTTSGATTDQATFTWDTGCQPITVPDGSGSVLVGDRLVVSMDNGSSPKLMKRAQITGSGGLAAFAIKEEVTH